jgi:outer membrane protein TolC
VKYSFLLRYAVFFFLFSVPLHAQLTGVFPESLTQEQAVTLALTHHPSLRGAEAATRSASAGVTQAQSNYFPMLSVSAGGTRTGGASPINPSFPVRILTYNNYITALSLQQNLYDFGKTSGRVSASEELMDASFTDFQATRDSVIANVQLAYINFVQSIRVVKVDSESVAQAEEHLKQSQAFYSVGTRPQYDVTTAEVNLANANVALITGRNQVRVAKLQLENAIGMYSTTHYTVHDSLETPAFAITLDSAKAVAKESRPELRSAQARYVSAQSSVSAARAQHLPTVSLNGGWTWSSFDFPLQSKWNAGFTLSMPIFEGFAISAQVEQAEAVVDEVHAGLDELMEGVMLQVEQNYLSLKEAQERIDASKKLVTQAKENLKLAEGRYNSGVGSPIEITDAQVTLSNAQITSIQALADYNSSLIRLRQAMGVIAQN